MIPILLFLRILAWGALILASLTVASITIGRSTETDTERLLAVIHGRAWRSRVPPMIVIFVATAWLYATWGES